MRSRPGRVCLALLVACVAVALQQAPAALGYTFGPTVQQLGPEETVFDWSTQRCDENFAADSPARAWRDSANQVHLTISSNHSPSMVGPNLNSVAVNCGILLPSDFNADPAQYDDQEWVVSPYTVDGSKMFALIHSEYHGWEHPGQCTSQGTPNRPKLGISPGGTFNPGCWYNAITLASSTNGGYTFTHTPAPSHLVASVPYKYAQSDAPYGYFSPSNVIKQSDGYYYSMIQTEAYGLQKLGECVIRSKNPTSVTSWRAWDGTGYNVKFINPYINPDPPDTHVCEPVAFPEIDKMVQSLTLSSFFGKYLLVGQSYDYEQGTGRVVYGAYYSTSTDLIHWSHRTLLMEAELAWSYQCGDENPIAYPVVLNPGSTARNFDTTKQINYLYFTRFNYVNCLPTWDLDLVRIPFKFLGPSPTG